MPAPARRRHRALALILSGGLALAGLVTAVGPAVAAPVPEGTLMSSVDFVDGGGGAPTCNAATDDKVTTGEFSSDGVAKTATSASNTKITDSADDYDVTTLTGRSSVTARSTVVAGSLGALDVSASLRGTLQSTYGASSSCDGLIQLVGGASASFEVARAGWLTLRSSKSKGGSAVVLLSGTDQDFQSSTMGVKGTDSYRLFLPRAGSYDVTLMVTSLVTPPTSPTSSTTSSTVTSSLRGEFRPAGSAVAASAGPGASYLALGAERSCAGNSLAATFTANAAKVKSAQIFVNGRRVATVRSPKRGRVVTLKNLDDQRAVSVRAVIVPKKGKTVSVTRSYLACS